MKTVLRYLNTIIRKDTTESAKRIVSLLTVVIIYYVVIRFTDSENVFSVLVALLSFVLSLLGVAAWEDVTKHNIDIKKNKDE